MKNKIFLFALILTYCYCLTRKRNLKIKLQQNNDLTGIIAYKYWFLGYAKTILNEINVYRHDNMYDPQIIWVDSLAKQAQLEADAIKSAEDFGQHARFEEYDQKTQNSLFTEFAVNIPISDKMPNQNAFAIMVLESILQEERFHIMHQYTHAGIALTENSKGYFVVLHMIKKLGTYASCKEALEKGDTLDQILIQYKEKKILTTCDQTTQDGGWTLILDSNLKTRAEPLHLAVDDKDLKYTQLLFKAKDNFHLSYDHEKENVWEMDGLIYEFFKFKFGDKLYTEVKGPVGGVHGQPITYNQDQVIQLIKPSTKCFIGGSNQIRRCGKEFILTKLPEGKLTEITELHTVENAYIDCNFFDLFFLLYVR